MEFLDWFSVHWFTLLQSAGIIGGLLFTAVSLRIDAKVRRVGNLIAVTHEHRDIWTQLYKRPELWRVVDRDLDLEQAPPTAEEELFVNFLILHLASVHEAMREGMFVQLPGVQRDIRNFFSLPIPNLVWGKLRSLQNIEFVAFIEKSLNAVR